MSGFPSQLVSDPNDQPPPSGINLSRVTPLDRKIHRWETICRVLDISFALLTMIGPYAVFAYLVKKEFNINVDQSAAFLIAAVFLFLLIWLASRLRLAILKKNKS
jgi:hypothetical protein